MSLPAAAILPILIAFQCLVLSLFLLLRRRGKLLSNGALGTMLGLLGIHMLVTAGQRAGLLETGLTLVHLSGFLYGPLFLTYVNGLVYERLQFEPKHLLHAVPFATAAVLLFADVLTESVEAILLFISIGAYLAASFLTLLRYQRVLMSTRSDLHIVSLRWLQFAIGALVVVYFFDIASFVSEYLANWPNAWIISTAKFILLLIYVNAFAFAAFEYPHLFKGISPEDEKIAAAPLTVRQATADDKRDADRIAKFMAGAKPYLKPELTISELAQMLGMPARRVSEAINLCFRQNFADFINSHRIEAAKERLVAPETRGDSVLDVLYAVGFNSKSSFNTIFKLKTGLSPTDFRAKYGQ